MKKIWILEDDQKQRKILTRILENGGYQVKDFSNCGDLFEKLDKNCEKPDIFLLDLALKDTLNGFQIAQKLIKEYEIKKSQFVFMTGWYKAFRQIIPPDLKGLPIIDKAEWNLEELKKIITDVME